MRDNVAQLYGSVVGFRGSPAAVQQELSLLSTQLTTGTKDLECLHGHILAVGYSIERAAVALYDTVNSDIYQSHILALGKLWIMLEYL